MKERYLPLPKASSTQLVTRKVAGELLVYDRTSDQAHCLNRTAAMVWERCDGVTTIKEVCQSLEAEMKVPVADEVVWAALDQLRESHLLPESFILPATFKQMSRRTLMKRLGIAAAVTIPLVTSIVAPTAASAATCRASGFGCTSGADCCSNSCVDNGRGAFECG